MQFRKLVPLKKVITNSLGKEKAAKYLKGIDDSYSDSSVYTNASSVYQDALTFLYDGDMDRAINYVVFGLDLDRGNKLLFNLCKNMTFLLSKHLSENNSDIYRQKYGASLDKAVLILNKKLRELQKDLEFEYSSLANLEIELGKSKPSFLSTNKFTVTHMLKKKKVEPLINQHKSNIQEYEKKYESMATDLEEIESSVHVEEDVKVLGLIIEVCVFPSKFEWLISKQEKSAENVT